MKNVHGSWGKNCILTISFVIINNFYVYTPNGVFNLNKSVINTKCMTSILRVKRSVYNRLATVEVKMGTFLSN